MENKQAHTRLDNFLEKLASFIHKHPNLIVNLAILLSILSLFEASKLNINWAEETFFPSGKSSYEERMNFADRVGGTSLLISVVEGGKLEDRKRFVKDWVRLMRVKRDEEIESGKDGLIRYFAHKMPLKFFEDGRFLYLKVEDLKDIKTRLSKRLDQEKSKINPFYIDLEEEAEPEVDISFTDLIIKYRIESFKEDLASNNDKMLAIVIKPTKPSFDEVFAKKVTSMVRKTGETLLEEHQYKDLSFSLGGRYAEQMLKKKSLSGGITTFILIAFIGFSVLTLIIFRRVKPAILIWMAALIGLSWTAAIAKLAFNSLSIVGIISLPVTLTFGLSYGILLIYGYVLGRQKNLDAKSSLVRSLTKEGRISIISGISLAVTMFIMAALDFADYQSFGFVTGSGILAMIIAMHLVLPAILMVSERFSVMVFPGSVWIGAPFPSRIPRGKSMLIAGIVIAIIGGGLLIQSYSIWNRPWCTPTKECCNDENCIKASVGFDYDFESLMGYENVASEIRRKIERTLYFKEEPLIAIADNRKTIKNFADDSHIYINSKNSTIAGLHTVFTFIPDNQPQKLEIMDEIDQLATKENLSIFDSKIRKKIDEVRPVLHPAPISLFKLPINILRLFSQQPAGSEKLLEILARTFSVLPDDINETAYQAALINSIKALGQNETSSILQKLEKTELGDYTIEQLDKWSDSEKEQKLYKILDIYHKKYVGTVAYIHPKLNLFQGMAVVKMQEQLDLWSADYPDLKIWGSPTDLARTLKFLKKYWVLMIIGSLLTIIATILIFIKQPQKALLVVIPVVFALLWLTSAMSLFSVKWNIYSLLVLPVFIGFGLDTALRVYLRYWETNQIGALICLHQITPQILLFATTTCIVTVGGIALNQYGLSNISGMSIAAVILLTIASLTVFPVILEQVHTFVRKK